MTTKYADSELWAKVVAMAREGIDVEKAHRKIRIEAGRDLTQNVDQFNAVYAKFAEQPLFARQTILSLRRKEFEDAITRGMLSIDTATDGEVDGVMQTLQDFEKGSFDALMACIERIKGANPDLAASLLNNAKTLWPQPFKAQEIRDAAAARDQSADQQLSLPSVGEQPAVVPDVPA